MLRKCFPMVALAVLLSCLPARGAEGMWIPLFLKKLNESQMQSLGMRITAEDIYSVNHSSIKDAVVLFGGGCTGEVVSPEGLLLTNHHCGYSQIAAHSTLEDNILENGFYARNRSEERINPSLSVTFIKRIEEVTDQALRGVKPSMSAEKRQEKIRENLERIRKEADIEPWQNVEVKSFFKDNRYFLFVRETFNDVRLVGCPPASVGKFGAETDNWVWPRHTGDFSVFRIYADRDNHPADPSPDNVPYRPDHYLPISLDGFSEGDFTLVFGFPGRTDEYLPGIALEQTIVRNPIKVGLRDIALNTWQKEMEANDTIKLLYANRYVSVANAWKKWQGESLGLERTRAVDKKTAYEAAFADTLAKYPAMQQAYGHLLPDLYAAYKELLPYGMAYDATSEYNYLNDACALMGLLARYRSLLGKQQADSARTEELRKQALERVDPRRITIDRKVFIPLTEFYCDKMPAGFLPQEVDAALEGFHGDMEALADSLYASPLLSRDGIEGIFAAKDTTAFDLLTQNDPTYVFFRSVVENYNRMVAPRYSEVSGRIDLLMKDYMKAQMEAFPDRAFFPDANMTLRASYGQVRGMQARDGLAYLPQTFLDGVIEKYIPGDREFDLPEKLIELYRKKDYGPYGENGRMPVCFIATNHTSGGNSGSPVINADGELIGLNFDRLWEGTMSDLNYDPSICRNIMVDIRYVLFLIDKLGGAGYLVDEMMLHRRQAD